MKGITSCKIVLPLSFGSCAAFVPGPWCRWAKFQLILEGAGFHPRAYREKHVQMSETVGIHYSAVWNKSFYTLHSVNFSLVRGNVGPKAMYPLIHASLDLTSLGLAPLVFMFLVLYSGLNCIFSVRFNVWEESWSGTGEGRILSLYL